MYSLKVTKRSFSHLSIKRLFCTGKNILLWWLKRLLLFCLNICGTMQISRYIKPLFNFHDFLKKIFNMFHKPSNVFFFLENLYNDKDIAWVAIYMLPRLIMHNTYMWSLQYKTLNNVLFLNIKLHFFE